MRKLVAIAVAASLAIGLSVLMVTRQQARAQEDPGATCPTRPEENAPARVIGGMDADLANWPGFVALRIADWTGAQAPFCGGTLIDPHWVVTAAHCVTHLSYQGEQPPARFGPAANNELVELSRGGDPLSARLEVVESMANIDNVDPANVIRPGGVFVHPTYVRAHTGDDIALVYLPRAARGQPMRLSMAPAADPGARNGSQVWVAGFGRTQANSAGRSRTLQEVALPLYEQNRCVSRIAAIAASQQQPRLLPANAQVNDGNICAGQTSLNQRPRDSCKGDSGGPLVRTGENGCPILVGVVSYGASCGLPDTPGVYTRISAYAPWIRQVVAGAPMRAVETANITPPVDDIREALAAIRSERSINSGSVQVRLLPPGDIPLGAERTIEISSATVSGYIIAFDIDADGLLTYLAPNRWAREPPRIDAGRTIRLPADRSYSIRAGTPTGPGRIVVVVSPDRALAERLQLETRAVRSASGFATESNAAADALSIAESAIINARSSDAPSWAFGEATYVIAE